MHFPRGLRQETALRLVQPGDALLDVGCGRGAVAALLSDRFREVHGVDGDAEALQAAAARGVRVERVDLDAAALPYEDGRFDAVLCLEVVEHVRDPSALARELARVLRRGGRLYVSTPNVRFVRYLADLVVRGRFPLTSEDPCGWQGGHVHFFTERDLDELLRSSGFDDVTHHGITSASVRASPLFRVFSRLVGERLTREFLLVGLFAVARRADAPVPPPPQPRAELRAG